MNARTYKQMDLFIIWSNTASVQLISINPYTEAPVTGGVMGGALSDNDYI